MTVPSIKGAAIQSVFEDILRLEESGGLATEVLEARLEAADLELLRMKLDVARWYPLTTYDRCTRLLCDHHAGDRDTYLGQRGHAAGPPQETTPPNRILHANHSSPRDSPSCHASFTHHHSPWRQPTQNACC